MMETNAAFDRNTVVIRTQDDRRIDDSEAILGITIQAFEQGDSTMQPPRGQVYLRLTMDQVCYLHTKLDERIVTWANSHTTRELDTSIEPEDFST